MERTYISALESILFVWSDEITLKKLSEILGISLKETRELVEILSKDYEERNLGMRIINFEDKVQMIANVDNYEYIEKLGKASKSKGLSKSTLETLALVAYKQPITKSTIDKVRGVKSDKAIQNLLEKNLIFESGRLDGPGKPILYSTTTEFLKIFDLKTIEDLTPIENFQDGEVLIKNLYEELDSDV